MVLSRTLDPVEGANTTLARGDLRAELTSLAEAAFMELVKTRTFSSRLMYLRHPNSATNQ